MEPVRSYLARRIDAATAEDVLSEVLLVLWRQSVPVPRGDEIAYAIGVARLQLQNATRSMRRQERLIARIITIDPPEHATAYAEPGDPRAELVREALAQLRLADAEVLRLHAWEELPLREIALVLGLTPNAASIRLHRAKKKLAERIRKMQGQTGHVVVKEGDAR